MKAFSLTVLIITTSLIIANLLGLKSPSSRQSFPITAQTVLENARVTGQTAIDAPAPKEFAASAVSASAVSAAAASAAAVQSQPEPTEVPADTGLLAGAPVAVDAPLDVAVALPDTQSSQLDTFTANIMNGQAGQVVGVFVQDAFALPVVQQPQGQSNYVSTEDQRVTQFAAPKAYNTVGLLAHNYLSGKLFFNLSENQAVVIVYGDGQQQTYRISHIQRYQALDPSSAYSDFVDVNDPSQTKISAATLFSRVYGQPDQLVFQTCIEANGDFSWGRLFITAEKVGE